MKSPKDEVRDSRRSEAMLIGYEEAPPIPEPVEVRPQDLIVEADDVRENGCSRAHSPAIPTYAANARSCLNNVCTAKRWKPPVFDCLVETGPDHLKRFVYKAVLQITGKSDEVFEFIGEPRSKKREAAESAAEGALWYLKHEGHIE